MIFVLKMLFAPGCFFQSLAAGRNLEMKDSEIAALNLCNDLAMLLNVPSQEKILKLFHPFGTRKTSYSDWI